jgi:hypothetical protein
MGLSGSAGAGLLDEPRGPEAQREGQQGVHHGQARQEDSTTQFRAKGALLSRMGAMPRTAGVHQISVAHDDWGGIFAGQRCACPLAITLPWSPPATA